MTISDKLAILNDAFTTLRGKGKIKNWTDFAKLLDINRTTLSMAKGGSEDYLTNSLIDKVNAVMKVQNSPTPTTNCEEYKQQSNNSLSALASPLEEMRYVPTIPVHAYRATNFDVMEYFRTTSDRLHLSPIVMQFPMTDCYFFVNSEEMSPELRTNDLLCLSRLPNEARVTNGDIYIINTKYQGILGRFVYDDGDHFILKSSQERWTDMRIPKNEVFSIFRILGGIRTNI